MHVIDRFMERYRREYDYYEQAARLVYEQLDGTLVSSGVRSIVTYRAKRPERLEQKLRQRARKRIYGSSKDIYNDIVDFAGVRVALYFPGAREEVDRIIRATFDLIAEPKSFPAGSSPSYEKRFSGYWATHYRLRLRESSLVDAQKRFAEARVEVQVASVLMHAWSEVEHDLVYKPLQGRLSEDEYAILDELNGLVLAGEIALERLQRAIQARVAKAGMPFSNHYELAAFLVKEAAHILGNGTEDSALGRVDALFELLAKLELNTPERVRPMVAWLHPDTEKRAVADQIIDQVVAADESRYRLYAEIRRRFDQSSAHVATSSNGRRKSEYLAFGQFLALWTSLEQRISDAAKAQGREGPEVALQRRTLERYLNLDPSSLRELDRIRALRNSVVHGTADLDVAVLAEATLALRRILKQLDGSHDEQSKPT